MKRQRIFTLLLVLILPGLGMLAAACGASESVRNAKETAIAAEIYATQTASAPTSTSTPTLTATPKPVPTFTPSPRPTETPTYTPKPTYTPTHTPTQTSTHTPTPTITPTFTPKPTPSPDAVVVSRKLNVRKGPGTNYPVIITLDQNTELDVVGRYKNCAWLKIQVRGQDVQGWVAGSWKYVDLRTPCDTLPSGTFRPMTGMIKRNQRSGGYGELSIDNGVMKDAVVILMFNNRAVAAAYIRANDEFTITGIKDGVYEVYFSSGTEWDGRKFTVDPSYKRFEDTFPFKTTETASYYHYTNWRITLYPVPGGTGTTQDLTEDAFPSLGD